ncbi:MAG: ABC transporter ATP-binding protein [Anaerolineales bacterium]
MSTATRLQANDLYFDYDHDIQALDGASLELGSGQSLALIGRNGSGKTTLAKCLGGVVRPSSGKVTLDGADLAGMSPTERAAIIGFVFQSPDHQIFSATTEEEIAFGPRQLGLSDAEVQRRTEASMTYFGLTPYRQDPPASLSFGLRRKITVASVHAMQPSIIILDEPTLGLDWQAATNLMEAMRSLQRRGASLVFVSHDLRLVAEYSQDCAVLQSGHIAAQGPTIEILTDDKKLASAGLSAPPIVELARQLMPFGLNRSAITVGSFVDAYSTLLAEAAA